jgi:hypothetical protein
VPPYQLHASGPYVIISSYRYIQVFEESAGRVDECSELCFVSLTLHAQHPG